jgi:guanylate kinase
MKIGPLFILSGPSGVGKSTVLNRVLAEAPWPMRLSVSVTTRRPRPGEVDGKHYHFRDVAFFLAAREAGKFLEWAEVYGNYYGTLEDEVAGPRREGKGVWLDIDVQGWRQVRQRCPEVVSIFLMTSTVELFEQRLRRRGTETDEAVGRRLRAAQAELAAAPQYNYQVCNDDLNTAVATIKAIIRPYFEGEESACTTS